MSMRSRGSACLGSASLGLCLFLQEHRGRRTRSWRTSLTTSLHRPERWQLRTVSLCSWGGVRADDRTFPSCVLILFCFFILVFFLHIFLSCFLFFSFLFMSLTHTPSTSPVFSLCQISHGGCPPPPEIIGGQVLQWESEQTNIQQVTTCAIHFFSPFLLQHLTSPRLPPPVLQLTGVAGKEDFSTRTKRQ